MPVRARAFERRVVSAARDDQSVLHVLHARTIAAGNPCPLICDTNFDRAPVCLPRDRFLSHLADDARPSSSTIGVEFRHSSDYVPVVIVRDVPADDFPALRWNRVHWFVCIFRLQRPSVRSQFRLVVLLLTTCPVACVSEGWPSFSRSVRRNFIGINLVRFFFVRAFCRQAETKGEFIPPSKRGFVFFRSPSRHERYSSDMWSVGGSPSFRKFFPRSRVVVRVVSGGQGRRRWTRRGWKRNSGKCVGVGVSTAGPLWPGWYREGKESLVAVLGGRSTISRWDYCCCFWLFVWRADAPIVVLPTSIPPRMGTLLKGLDVNSARRNCWTPNFRTASATTWTWTSVKRVSDEMLLLRNGMYRQLYG